MILADLHSIIRFPPPGDQLGELRFSHALLPDFLLDRSCSKDLFLDQGAAYAKLTGLAVKHINISTESPLEIYQCMSSLCCDFIYSMRMKTVFISHFGCVASKLVHPRSSLRTCAGLTLLFTCMAHILHACKSTEGTDDFAAFKMVKRC